MNVLLKEDVWIIIGSFEGLHNKSNEMCGESIYYPKDKATYY